MYKDKRCSAIRAAKLRTSPEGEKNGPVKLKVAAFSRPQFVRDHRRRYHSLAKLLCCYCGEKYTSESAFITHEKLHNGLDVKLDPSKEFQCKICTKILASQELLEEHQERHDHPGAYKYRLNTKGKKRVDFGNPYKRNVQHKFCHYCKVDFEDSTQFNHHKIDSDCTKFYKRLACDECGKEFHTQGAYYFHKKNHKDEATKTEYTCKFCSQKFDRYTKYHQHKKHHTRKRKHLCEACGMAFYSKTHLDNHVRLHTGEKPFVCKVCNKAFSYKVNQQVHEKLHFTEAVTAVCYLCGKTFRDQTRLGKHLRRYHGNSAASQKKPFVKTEDSHNVV